MKKVFFIPILALIFAVGMSFTTFETEEIDGSESVASDYVYNNGNWEPIPQQNCTGGNETCQVQFGKDGPVFDLYDEMDLSTRKETGDGTIIILNP